jgi:hypothetical protein
MTSTTASGSPTSVRAEAARPLWHCLLRRQRSREGAASSLSIEAPPYVPPGTNGVWAGGDKIPTVSPPGEATARPSMCVRGAFWDSAHTCVT